MDNHEYIPQRAMSIQAHPDDQEFSIGGTLAKWSKAGCERWSCAGKLPLKMERYWLKKDLDETSASSRSYET